MKKDINNMKQNHPELIVNDIMNKIVIRRDEVREILKNRGVNKWFRVRKLLIQLKHQWKYEIQGLEETKKLCEKGSKEFYQLQGYVKALINCRQQVRALCHSPRDVDFPENTNDTGYMCILPVDFPDKPPKKYFYRYDEKFKTKSLVIEITNGKDWYKDKVGKWIEVVDVSNNGVYTLAKDYYKNMSFYRTIDKNDCEEKLIK